MAISAKYVLNTILDCLKHLNNHINNSQIILRSHTTQVEVMMCCDMTYESCCIFTLMWYMLITHHLQITYDMLMECKAMTEGGPAPTLLGDLRERSDYHDHNFRRDSYVPPPKSMQRTEDEIIAEVNEVIGNIESEAVG